MKNRARSFAVLAALVLGASVAAVDARAQLLPGIEIDIGGDVGVSLPEPEIPEIPPVPETPANEVREPVEPAIGAGEPAILSLNEIMAIVRTISTGQIIDVGILRIQDRLIYEVRILGADGTVSNEYFDGITGAQVAVVFQ